MSARYAAMAWRFLRVFISSFLVSSSVLLVNVSQENLLDWRRWIPAVILSGMTGAISAVGKFIRDEFGLAKLPI